MSLLLEYAIREGWSDDKKRCIQNLIANINVSEAPSEKLIRDCRINTILSRSIHVGDQQVFDFLLRYAPELAKRQGSSEGYTPLMWAAQYGRVYMVEKLIRSLRDDDNLSVVDHIAKVDNAIVDDVPRGALSWLEYGIEKMLVDRESERRILDILNNPCDRYVLN